MPQKLKYAFRGNDLKVVNRLYDALNSAQKMDNRRAALAQKHGTVATLLGANGDFGSQTADLMGACLAALATKV